MDLWTPTRRLHVVPPRNNYFFIKNVRIPKTSFSITYFVLANCNCFITCLSRMGKDKGVKDQHGYQNAQLNFLYAHLLHVPSQVM